MAANLFNRYVWLLDVVGRYNGITYEQINEAWQRSHLNDDRAPLPKRTLHNHINAIETMFGVRIVCRRHGGYKYYIEGELEEKRSNTRSGLLSQLQLSNAMMSNSPIAGRILTNRILHVRFFSPLLIAMEESKHVHVVYRDCSFDENDDIRYKIRHLRIAPYMLKQMGEFRWFLLGFDHEDRQLHAFDLCNIEHISVMESTFTMPKEFDIDDFTNSFYTAEQEDRMRYDDHTFFSLSRMEKLRYCDIWSGEVI